MDLQSLKAIRVDHQFDVEHLRKLHAEFGRYVEELRQLLVGQGDVTGTQRLQHALKLRLDADQGRFLEWHDGDKVLNADVWGLLEDPVRYGNIGMFDETVARAHAKFGHLLEEAELELRKTEAEIAELEPPRRLKVTREGVFGGGQQFDAFRQVQSIVSEATKAITLIDGYVDETVLDLLTGKPDKAVVSILTQGVTPALRLAATKFNEQYGGLAVRTSRAFHDRFLIIDDTEFYHFGASIKDAGRRGFMFSRIEEPIAIDSLRQHFHNAWATASEVTLDAGVGALTAKTLEEELDVDLQSFGSSQRLTHFTDSDYSHEGVFVAFPNVVLTNRSSRHMALMVSLHIPLVQPNPLKTPDLVARTERRTELMGVVQRHLHGYAMREMLVEPIRIAPGNVASGVLMFCIKRQDLGSLSDGLERYEEGARYLRVEDKPTRRVSMFRVERAEGQRT